MTYKFVDSVGLTATGTAQDAAVDGRAIYIQNTHASNSLYVKEKFGTAATTTNALKIAPGAITPFPLRLYTMSYIASGAGTTFVAIIVSE